jgi:hypothetical protein
LLYEIDRITTGSKERIARNLSCTVRRARRCTWRLVRHRAFQEIYTFNQTEKVLVTGKDFYDLSFEIIGKMQQADEE